MMPLWISATRFLAIEHRVSVALGRRLRGSPSGCDRGRRLLPGLFFQLFDQPIQFALGLDGLELAVPQHYHTGRIVAPILETAQPIEDQRDDPGPT